MAFAEPMPKSQLFWIGTLMRLATGFDSFLASSAAAAFSSVAASCANAVVVVSASALTSATAMRFCLCVVFIVICLTVDLLVLVRRGRGAQSLWSFNPLFLGASDGQFDGIEQCLVVHRFAEIRRGVRSHRPVARFVGIVAGDDHDRQPVAQIGRASCRERG